MLTICMVVNKSSRSGAGPPSGQTMEMTGKQSYRWVVLAFEGCECERTLKLMDASPCSTSEF